MTRTTPIHPLAWLLWLVAAGAIPLTGRHPLYLTLNLMVVLIVHLSIPSDDGAGRPWRLFAYVGTTVAVLSIGFNVLTVHSGDRAFGQLPEGLPIVGGPLTYNALVYGIGSALAISTLLFAAATFNTAVRHAMLIRILPARLQQLGVAGSIALTFVPQTMSAGRDIYDAQRARGRRMRGVRDAHAFFVPLLATGLERAFSLSEALETRGYGSTGPTGESSSKRSRASTPIALALVVVALPLLATGRIAAGFGLLAAAAALLVLTGSQATVRRRRTDWNRSAQIMALSSTGALAIIAFKLLTTDDLGFMPFPVLVWPGFDFLVGVAIVLLLTPAFVISRDPT